MQNDNVTLCLEWKHLILLEFREYWNLYILQIYRIFHHFLRGKFQYYNTILAITLDVDRSFTCLQRLYWNPSSSFMCFESQGTMKVFRRDLVQHLWDRILPADMLYKCNTHFEGKECWVQPVFEMNSFLNDSKYVCRNYL